MIVAIRKTCAVINVFWRPILALLIPLILLPLPLIVDTKEAKCGYVVLWMAFYWMFEPIPLAVTALLPVVMFPLLGLLTTSEACTPYMKDTIMMYIGGLTLAAAVEHCNLHKRIALKVLLLIGTGARWLMLGFMVTTMFLSMWISNTATTAMMVPIVDAVLSELQKEEEFTMITTEMPPNYSVVPLSPALSNEIWRSESSKQKYTINEKEMAQQNEKHKKLRNCLLLSVAYAANCGGTGTIIGSGPNLVLKGYMEETFPESTDLTFATWLMYNAPGMMLCVILSWITLQLFYLPICSESNESTQVSARNAILRSYNKLGNISFHEIAVAILFLMLVVLWFLRDPQFIRGWLYLFPPESKIRDATPAIGICLLLFVIPAKPSLSTPSAPLLDWRTAQRKISWGVLLLLGSGFAVAEAAKKSHLSAWLGLQLSHLNFLSADAIVVVLTLMTCILTEVISNMSMATIMLPVISKMAQAIQVHPLYFMLPVTICCSFAMMLPVGNPSNAIVFDAGSMKTSDMIKPGFVLKILCCGIQLMMIKTLGVIIFDLTSFPAWALDNKELLELSTEFNTTWLLSINDTLS